MEPPKTRQIDLVVGGGAWTGWRFGPYGRARDWRLHAPDGAIYTAGEVGELHDLQLDVGWLHARVRTLEEQSHMTAWRLGTDDLQTLRAAADILGKLPGRRANSRKINGLSDLD